MQRRGRDQHATSKVCSAPQTLKIPASQSIQTPPLTEDAVSLTPGLYRAAVIDGLSSGNHPSSSPMLLLSATMIFPLTRAAILVASLLVASAALVSASESATKCPPGSFSKTGKSPCALCDPGTFQPGMPLYSRSSCADVVLTLHDV